MRENSFVKREPTPKLRKDPIELWANWLLDGNNCLWQSDIKAIYNQGIKFGTMPQITNDIFSAILKIARLEYLSTHPDVNRYANPDDLCVVTPDNVRKVGGYAKLVEASIQRAKYLWPNFDPSEGLDVGNTMKELLKDLEESEKTQ